jgi:hypothetical protein
MTYIEFSNNVMYMRTSYKLPTFPANTSPYNRMKPIFTDNSKVVYKPHSLASGGVGTVRNSFMKARKT